MLATDKEAVRKIGASAGIEAWKVAVGIGAQAIVAAKAERPARNKISQGRNLRMKRCSAEA
jgi:hypothetical protein